MTSLLKKPFVQLTVFTIGVIFIVQGLGSIRPEWLYPHVYWLYLFFFVITSLSLLGLEQIRKHQPDKFINSYFIIMLTRLFISLGLALIFIIFDKQNAKIFVANFAALYLFFLGFEIYGILTNLRQHFKNSTEND